MDEDEKELAKVINKVHLERHVNAEKQKLAPFNFLWNRIDIQFQDLIKPCLGFDDHFVPKVVAQSNENTMPYALS